MLFAFIHFQPRVEEVLVRINKFLEMKSFLLILGLFSVCFAQEFYAENGKNGPTTQDREGKIPEINGKRSELVKKFQIINANLLTDDYFRSKDFAIGLLSRHKWNVSAASKSLKKLVLWRSANHIEKLGKLEADSELLKFFPYNITDGTTKEGCPVFLGEAGKWLLADFIESHEYVRDAIKLINQYNAQLLEKSRLAVLNSNCSKMLFIVDGKGFATTNYAEANSLSAIIHFATIIEKFYPNLFQKFVVFNAEPNVITTINIVLPYLGQSSKDFVLFSEEESDKVQTFLSQYLDIDQLKKFVN